jgi:threonine/homoserine/homoserine lactone efflux protein
VAFTVLKLAGAAYLIYLGISTLRSPHAVAGTEGRERRPLPSRQAYAQGLVSALLNPKLGVFFLTLLPQFIAPGDTSAIRALQLAVVFDLIGIAWLLTYSALLAALGRVLGRGTPQRIIRWVSGTVLVALGVRVALART